MKCIRVVGQGVPCRVTNEVAFRVVDLDKDGEYCSKRFFKEWYANDPAARENATDVTGKRLLR